VGTGAELASEYKLDLMGADQTLLGGGWEMGAFGLVPESTGRAK
jgi:hypothetical protein